MVGQFKRDIYFKVKEMLENNSVVFLLGPRKCGKTICMQQLSQNCSIDNQYIDFKLLSDEESFKTISKISNDILDGVNKIYFIDEATYIWHPQEEISRLAGVYSKAIALGVNISTKLVFAGSQSIALNKWGHIAFCSNAAYIHADFLSYKEWLSYKGIEDINEDSYNDYIMNVSEFYRFTSLKDYLEGCLDETVISNSKTKDIIFGNDCSLLTVDVLLNVLYATLFSMHNQTSPSAFFKNNSLHDKLSYLIATNILDSDINSEILRERIKLSYISKYNYLQSVDFATLKQAFKFLSKSDLIILTSVSDKFINIIDTDRALEGEDPRVQSKDELFSKINFTIKYPMFYVEILKDIFKTDMPKKINGALLGEIVECNIRGLLPCKNIFEYHDNSDYEIDYVNMEQLLAVEMSVSNKKLKETHFEMIPSNEHFLKILTTKNQSMISDKYIRIPYYSFIYNASCGYEKLINDVKIDSVNHGCVVSDALNNNEVEEDEIEL